METETLSSIAKSVATSRKALQVLTKIDVNDQRLIARLPIHGSTVCIRVDKNQNGTFNIGLVGLNATATRWIRDLFSFCTRLEFTDDKKEIQLLYRNINSNVAAERIFDAADTALRMREQEERADYDPQTTVGMYWSSSVLNFGDWMGPLLVNQFTGRQPVQANRPGSGPRVLYSVGSILGWFNRNNVDVWGSGLIKPLTDEEVTQKQKLTGVRIHAVRGHRTQDDLQQKLGWAVPDVYGDPALLLPSIIPSAPKSRDLTLVPHNIHRGEVLKHSSLQPEVVDARADVYDVAASISSSNVIISSSLHGLIVAQAYNVPWVWLQVDDAPLMGSDFKFEDFFTCVDRTEVSAVAVSKRELSSLDYASIARQASLPKLSIDLDALRNSLPVQVATSPVDPLWLTE